MTIAWMTLLGGLPCLLSILLPLLLVTCFKDKAVSSKRSSKADKTSSTITQTKSEDPRSDPKTARTQELKSDPKQKVTVTKTDNKLPTTRDSIAEKTQNSSFDSLLETVEKTPNSKAIKTKCSQFVQERVNKDSQGRLVSTYATPQASVSSGSGVENQIAWANRIMEIEDLKTLAREFKDYKRYADPTRTLEAHLKNTEKDRYSDMPVFDQNRVILRKWRHDYINASRIDAPDGVPYIACQGPLLTTADDFWHMIIQEKTNVILQLCKFVEESFDKCAEYWPKSSVTLSFKTYLITRVRKPERVFADVEGLTKTLLRVESQTDKSLSRTVMHVLWETWPDKDAPIEPVTTVRLWNFVKSVRKDGPAVVHCSAGVGRTCTFIGLSYCVERSKSADFKMGDVVKELRSMRPKAVQMYIQYAFLCTMLIEYLADTKVIPRDAKLLEFYSKYKALAERNAAKYRQFSEKRKQTTESRTVNE